MTVCRDEMLWCYSYLVDPVVEGRDSGEDGGFLNKVAAEARDEAGNAVNLPGAVVILAVQRATRIALDTEREEEEEEDGLCFIHSLESLVDWQSSAVRSTIRFLVLFGSMEDTNHLSCSSRNIHLTIILLTLYLTGAMGAY